MNNLLKRTVAGCAVLAAMCGLAACSGDGSDAQDSPSPSIASLASLDEVSVSADMDAQPTVDASWPVSVDETQWKVVRQGDGIEVPSDSSPVKVQYVGINARTGESFDSSWERKSPVAFRLSNLVKGFGKGVVHQKVGSRVLIAIPPEDGYGAQGLPQAGIQPEDTLLFVVDILDTEHTIDASGAIDADGMPKVKEGNGAPKIEFGKLDEPAKVASEVLVTGDGRALEKNDVLTSHAVCATWDGKEFYNDFKDLAADDALAAGVHEAIWDELVGHKAGSRVLITLPGDVAYPNGSNIPPVPKGASAACVVDMLFTAPQN